MSEASIAPFMATCFLVYMLQDFENYSQAPLMVTACATWAQYIKVLDLNRNTRIWALLLELLDPKGSHFCSWSEAMSSFFEYYFPVWSAPTGAEACLTLAYIVWLNLPEAARLFFKSYTGIVPLEQPLLWKEYPEAIPLGVAG